MHCNLSKTVNYFDIADTENRKYVILQQSSRFLCIWLRFRPSIVLFLILILLVLFFPFLKGHIVLLVL